MSFRAVPIGELVEPVKSWNPRTMPEGKFSYIDLSAVDQIEKRITGATSLRGSEAPSRARQLIKSGDILVSTVRPNLNGVAVVTEKFDDATASTGFCVLRSRIECLDNNYLKHWVRSPSFVESMVKQATGASYPAVSDRIVKSSRIPLPPLEEQRRIAAILDKADALRRKRKRALSLVKSIGHSSYHLTVGGSYLLRVPFEEAVFFQEGPGVRNWQFRDEGVKLINVRNIVNGRLDISNTNRFISEHEITSRYKHFLLEPGDFVLASSGVTWGKIAEVKEADLPLCLNTSVIRIRPRPPYSKAYVRLFIESGDFRNQIERLITGSAQPNFGPSHLKQVIIPSISSDSQIKLERLDMRVHTHHERLLMAIETSESLFTSLQHRAFTGQL